MCSMSLKKAAKGDDESENEERGVKQEKAHGWVKWEEEQPWRRELKDEWMIRRLNSDDTIEKKMMTTKHVAVCFALLPSTEHF